MKKSILLFAAIALASLVKAQDKSTDTSARYFIIQVSIGNLQEVAMSRVAAEKAVDPEIRAFAKRMVTDHTKAEEQLMQLIKTRGFQIPSEATEPPVEDMMLKNTPAKDFDKTYVHQMVPGHRQTVQLFEKYTLTGKDADVRAYAQQTLPVLKEHLAAILAIDQRLSDAAAK